MPRLQIPDHSHKKVISSMSILLIDSLVSLFNAALAADEERYWDEREREFDDYSDYYHCAYSDF
jgi:hypothetical protein